MVVGSVKEIKRHEYRVGLTPHCVKAYVSGGIRYSSNGVAVSKPDTKTKSISKREHLYGTAPKKSGKRAKWL